MIGLIATIASSLITSKIKEAISKEEKKIDKIKVASFMTLKSGKFAFIAFLMITYFINEILDRPIPVGTLNAIFDQLKNANF